MFAEERRQSILAKLKESKRIIAKDLVEEFHVSIDTIRRDLAIMEEDGTVKRTHGGAILPPQVRKRSSKPEVRFGEGTPQQNAIAKKAAFYINEGDTIFIGGGSIQYVLLKYLPTDIKYTVITNSLNIANKLIEFDNIEFYIVCGKVRKTGSIVDAFASELINTLRVDVAFLTCGGISAEHGMSTATREMAAFQKTVAQVSRKKICLAPYTKIGCEFFTRVMEVDKLDLLITDWEASQDEVDRIRECDVEVLIVTL